MGASIYDITPLVSPRLAVFPGDTKPSREVLLDMRRGHPITLSTLRATVHLGAHADAPSHYGVDGRTIDQQPLDLYIGPCEVLAVDVARGGLIGVDHVHDHTFSTARVLFRTGTYPDPESWNDDFAAVDPALVDHLARCDVRLVGVDTPSVDPATSKSLDAHHRFLANDMAILEGLVLRDVPPGMYELLALPLRLEGFDGSPVRAVLRSE